MTSKGLQRVFITGASSGIGEALARAYADSGVVLGLGARRIDRLRALKAKLEASGAVVHVYELDVTDAKNVQQVADQFTKVVGGIDLVIANAGVAGWGHPVKDATEKMTTMVEVNINGVIRTLTAFLPTMVKQRSGHIVAVSSIAGFKALPGGVYSATKAAVRYLMDGWATDLAPYNIQTSSIFPGFVTSEMTRGEWYPFLISADAAAAEMKAGIAAGKHWIILPWQWRVLIPVLRLVPTPVIAWLRRWRERSHR